MWGPEDLGAAVEGDGFEGFAVLVIGEEGDVVGWVPVLSGIDGEACGFEGGGGGGDGGEVGGVGAGDGEGAFVGFGEVALDVDDDDGGSGCGWLWGLGSLGRSGGCGEWEEGEEREEGAARGHGGEEDNKWGREVQCPFVRGGNWWREWGWRGMGGDEAMDFSDADGGDGAGGGDAAERVVSGGG